MPTTTPVTPFVRVMQEAAAVAADAINRGAPVAVTPDADAADAVGNVRVRIGRPLTVTEQYAAEAVYSAAITGYRRGVRDAVAAVARLSPEDARDAVP